MDTPMSLRSLLNNSMEISLRSSPGDYESILKKVYKSIKDISFYEIKDSVLRLYTNSPNKVLSILFNILQKDDEEIIDINLGKPELQEIFELLIQK
jgi:hypothetical protein